MKQCACVVLCLLQAVPVAVTTPPAVKPRVSGAHVAGAALALLTGAGQVSPTCQ